MRISDWSSDVCSSDLLGALFQARARLGAPAVDADLARAQQLLQAAMPEFGEVQAKPAVEPHVRLAGRHFSNLDAAHRAGREAKRSEARRVGKECVGTFRFRWGPDN